MQPDELTILKNNLARAKQKVAFCISDCEKVKREFVEKEDLLVEAREVVIKVEEEIQNYINYKDMNSIVDDVRESEINAFTIEYPRVRKIIDEQDAKLSSKEKQEKLDRFKKAVDNKDV